MQTLNVGKRRRRNFRKGKKKGSAMKMVKRLARKLKPEIKFSNFSNFNATSGVVIPLNTAAVIQSVDNIAQGTNVLNRIGNRIKVLNLAYKAYIANNTAADQEVRITFFYWNSSKVPVLTDIISYAAAAAGIADASVAPINQINVRDGYLKVLYDKVHFLETNAQSNSGMTVNMFLRINKYEKYIDTAGGDKRTGLYYLISSTSAVQTTCSDNCQITFTDC